jgi:hypothetical protein
VKIRDLVSMLRSAGGLPGKVRGSHQTWRVKGRPVTLLVNHMNDDAPHYMVAAVVRAIG